MLGSGSQGEVYSIAMAEKEVALKWYYPHVATEEQNSALKKLITKGAPDSRYLWPFDLTSSDKLKSFGYLMPLRDKRFVGITRWYSRKVEATFKSLTTACFQLAESFYELHANGWCYKDISFGNIFFDPASGDALICDCDNIRPPGETNNILGTPKYMAPEIIAGKSRPSTLTDLYSLATLFFYIMMLSHPLDGKREAEIDCLDMQAMGRLYGTDPVFIYDPENKSNRPLPGYHDNAIQLWPIYPTFLRDLFISAFTIGLKEPHKRVGETEWKAAMARLRDLIVYCPKCGRENFFDDRTSTEHRGENSSCWQCHAEIHYPFRVKVNKRTVMLNRDTKLFPHHTDADKRYDFSSPTAEVTRNPHDTRIWGLTNLSTVPWSAVTPDGDAKEVKTGRSIKISPGLTINFGNLSGQIVY